jgi:hypothetical protein
MDKMEIKKQLLNFTVNAVENFLNEHSNLEFYSFAYDCNAEYAEINLCFNTKTEFEKTLKQYQTGRFSMNYQSEEDINGLKFNTGDWEYQCFETLNVLTDDELTKILNDFPEDDYKSWNEFVETLREIICETLLDFSKTETFIKIPKTDNFIAFCIDHDEDFEDAIKRLDNVKEKYTNC